MTAGCACGGTGRVRAFDPQADGHGGLNGGGWTMFVCDLCKGTGVRVCPSCGASMPAGHCEDCEAAQ